MHTGAFPFQLLIETRFLSLDVQSLQRAQREVGPRSIDHLKQLLWFQFAAVVASKQMLVDSRLLQPVLPVHLV